MPAGKCMSIESAEDLLVNQKNQKSTNFVHLLYLKYVTNYNDPHQEKSHPKLYVMLHIYQYISMND